MMARRSFWKRIFLGTVFTLGGLFFLQFILSVALLPRWLEKRFVSSVQKACPTCRIEIEKTDVSLWKGQLRLLRPRLIYTDAQGLVLSANLRSLDVLVSLASVFSETKRIQRILLNKPEVVITEQDRPKSHTPRSASHATANAAPVKPELSIVLNNMEIREGSFRYEKKTNGKGPIASLTITKIRARMDEAGTTSDLLWRPLHGHLTGQIEKSGQLELDIETAPFVRPNEAYINLRVTDSNLSDVNRYFSFEEGVVLQGTLSKGHARVHVKDQKLQGHVCVHFDGLELEFKEKQDRSLLETFFSNLGKNLTLKKSNLSDAPSQRRQEIDKTREPNQSFISFILTGIGDAAIKVATF